METAFRARNARNYEPVGARRSVESFNHDGVELARLRRHRRQLPWRQIWQFALAVLSFKIFLFFQMGAAAYGAKIAHLSEGGLIERIAAKAMILDPASMWLIDLIRFGPL